MLGGLKDIGDERLNSLWKMARAVAAAHLGGFDGAEVEDVVAAAMEDLIGALESRKLAIANLEGFVNTATRNAASDAKRARARRPLSLDDLMDQGAAPPAAENHVILFTAQDIEETLTESQTKLKPEVWGATRLWLIDGLSATNIANRLGWSADKAERKLKIGREYLRKWARSRGIA